MTRKFAGPLALVLLTVCVFWKMLLTDQYTWLNSPDFAYQVAPWLQFQAAQWHQGHPFPLWDPHHLAGQSLIGQMQPGVLYPLNWLLFLTPLSNGVLQQVWLHWYYAAIHMMAALFSYALCRDLGCSRTASVLGGAAFAFGGYVGSTGWPQMLNGAVWAPLILLFTFRACRGEALYRNAGLSGACLGLSYLSGHPQVPTFLMLAISALWLVQIIQRPRLALAFAMLAAIAFFIAAPQILPAIAYGKDSVRWVGLDHPVTWKEIVPYSIHTQFGLPATALLGVFIPGVFANSDPYLGLTTLLLAICGSILAWRRREVRMLSWLAAGGLLLALSSRTLLHGLLYVLAPGMEKARNPSMAQLLFCVAASTLAAFGVDAIDAVWRKRLALSAGLVAALGWLAASAPPVFKLELRIDADRLAMAALSATVLAVMLIGARRRALFLIPLLLEIGTLPTNNWASRTQGWPVWDAVSRDADVAAFLRAQPQPIRVDVNDTDVPYNFGDWYGIDTFAGGLFASMPERTLNALWNDHAKQMAGVNYAVAKLPPKPGMRELFTGASGVKVFAVEGAVARVRADGTCPGSEVRLTRYEPSRAIIAANMRCRGLVILGDAYSPDWKATVDGQRVPLQAPEGLLRGVMVDSGQHTVELFYRPSSFYWGVALACAALAVLTWMVTVSSTSRA